MALEIREKVELASLTWWKVGGAADYFCLPRTVEQVQEALAWVKQKTLPFTVLGGGSNVLISDQGIEGLVIGLKELVGLQVVSEKPDLKIEALAGTGKSEAVKVYLKHKLSPAHFLCGLPGDLGGGVVMNAGVGEAIVPREFTEIVEWFEVARPEGDVKRFAHDQVKWHYRHSEGWQPGVVVRVGLKWPNAPDEKVMDKVREATKSRVAKQPLNMPSCGSVFKNPEGHKAGALIDKCGLKGFTIGGAQVSPKHANFIVNIGKAKAADVNSVIEHVRSTVRAQCGVELQTEVKYLGRW